MIFHFGDCQLDVSRYELRREGKLCAVEPKAFDLILLLLKNRDRLVTKNEVLDVVWSGRIVSEATLSSCVKAARRAIGDNGKEQKYIRTVPRRGFRFIGKIEGSEAIESTSPFRAAATQSAGLDLVDSPPAAGIANPAYIVPVVDVAAESAFYRWLIQLGMQDYIRGFKDNAIDFEVLSELDDADLKEMGLPLGHRKRLLVAAAQLQNRAILSIQPANVTFPREYELQQSSEDIDCVSYSGSERRHVTMLAAGLIDFAYLSSVLDLEELQELMTEFFGIVDGAIRKNGGAIATHLSDSVVAVFGAPVSHGDDTSRTVRAASEIHERLKSVRTKPERALSSHIGIASGEVLVGAGTNPLTVTGDAVSLASRLRDLAKAHETLLSGEVHSAVFRETLCEQCPNVSVEGLDHSLTVWKVVGKRDSPLRRDLLPFVGREVERAQFESTIAAIPARGSGAAFIFRGEPGIGKTRLATECLALARQHKFVMHHVLVLDFGAGTGTDPLRAVFQSLLGLSERSTGDALTDAANELLHEPEFGADDEAFVFDLLNLPLSVDALAFYAAIENTTRNRRKIDLVTRMLEKRAHAQPLIVFIDDLQWANAVTMNLCASLSARSAKCPAVILMTSRIEGDPFNAEWRSLTGTTPIYTVDLRPLSQQETQHLADIAGGDKAERLVAEMAKAGGNPLFLEMIIRSSADNQAEVLSGNLRSMVQARVDQLEQIDRRAIQAASVIGQRFDLNLVQHLIDEPDYQPKGLLERSLVHPMGDHFLFAHALVQEGVYASVTRRNAKAMHLNAADWFDGRDLILRAEHLSRANDNRAASAYYQAARSQSQLLRFETALSLLDKGLAHSMTPADRYDMNELKGQLALRTGGYKVAADAYRAAAEDASSEVERCRAYLGLADSNRERPGDALEEANRSLDLVQKMFERLPSDTFKVEYYAIRSSILIAKCDINGSLENARMGVELAEKIGDPHLLCRTLERFGPVHYQIGAMLSAKRICERLVKTAKQINDKGYEITGSVQLSICCHYANLFDEAIEIIATPLQEAERFGAGRAACVGHEYVTRTYLARGQIDEASYHAKTALELARVGGMKSREAVALVHVAETLLLKGDLDAAFDCARSAHEITEGPLAGPWAVAAMALARISKPDGHKYMTRARSLLDSRFFTSHNHFRVSVAEMEFGLYHQDWNAIDRAANSLEEFTSGEPLPWTDFHIKRGRAIALWGRGEQDDTYAAALEDLINVRRDLNMTIWLPGDD